MRDIFYSSNEYGFADISPCDFHISDDIKLIPYSKRIGNACLYNKTAHFFLDDYRFESTWNRPMTALERILKFWGALSPDFSIYTDWPLAAQIWNTYRARWVTRFWQVNGVRVIPTVNWSNEASFGWCFVGLPKHSIVAIGVPDLRNKTTRYNFYIGFEKMIETLEPIRIITYGKLPFNCFRCIQFNQDWINLRDLD